jgi:hypothetical protein
MQANTESAINAPRKLAPCRKASPFLPKAWANRLGSCRCHVLEVGGITTADVARDVRFASVRQL